MKTKTNKILLFSRSLGYNKDNKKRNEEGRLSVSTHFYTQASFSVTKRCLNKTFSNDEQQKGVYRD